MSGALVQSESTSTTLCCAERKSIFLRTVQAFLCTRGKIHSKNDIKPPVRSPVGVSGVSSRCVEHRIKKRRSQLRCAQTIALHTDERGNIKGRLSVPEVFLNHNRVGTGVIAALVPNRTSPIVLLHLLGLMELAARTHRVLFQSHERHERTAGEVREAYRRSSDDELRAARKSATSAGGRSELAGKSPEGRILSPNHTHKTS